jgi:hypothetical protein
VIGCVLERFDAGYRVLEFIGPAQWCEPSLSNSVLNPDGIRGASRPVDAL